MNEFIEEAFEDRFKKEATNSENVYDSAIHHKEKAGVEIHGNADTIIQLRKLRMTLKTE